MTGPVQYREASGTFPQPTTFIQPRNPGPADDRNNTSQVAFGVGFTAGSYGINTATGRVFFCLDSTVNAAVWALVATGQGLTASIEAVIDGAGSVISTGTKAYVEVPWACTITRSTILADRSGSIVVDVWRCTETQFDAGSTHPVVGDSITGGNPPTISVATKAQDSTLAGWTTALNAGDILAFNVNSVATIQRVTLALDVTKT